MMEAVCKGSMVLGTGCGWCSRCRAESAAAFRAWKVRRQLAARVGSATGGERINIDAIALDVAREIKKLDPIAMPGGHDQHLAAIQSLVADGIRAVLPSLQVNHG